MFGITIYWATLMHCTVFININVCSYAIHFICICQYTYCHYHCSEGVWFVCLLFFCYHFSFFSIYCCETNSKQQNTTWCQNIILRKQHIPYSNILFVNIYSEIQYIHILSCKSHCLMLLVTESGRQFWSNALSSFSSHS